MNHLDKTLSELRSHLDDVGFANLYRYIVSIRNFHLSPLLINASSQPAVLATETYLDAPRARALDGKRLCYTLMAELPARLDELDAAERDLAAQLCEAGLLLRDGDTFRNAEWQLIVVGDAMLLIDAAITFPHGRGHEVYIGPDTHLLLHYIDLARLPRGARVLDLCTGSGVIGQFAARAAARVVSTDIAERPLVTARMNRVLNRMEDVIEVREEHVTATLARPERWDLITCNPPFIATPPGLDMPLFARGPGRDGLDMMRDIVASLDRTLTEHGSSVMVADMLGDARRPFYVEELAALADRYAIDVYIDQQLDAEQHVKAIATILARVNPGRTPEAILAETRAFVREELRAEFLYLTVVRLRRGRARGLTVHNRFLSVDHRSQEPPGRT